MRKRISTPTPACHGSGAAHRAFAPGSRQSPQATAESSSPWPAAWRGESWDSQNRLQEASSLWPLFLPPLFSLPCTEPTFAAIFTTRIHLTADVSATQALQAHAQLPGLQQVPPGGPPCSGLSCSASSHTLCPE